MEAFSESAPEAIICMPKDSPFSAWTDCTPARGTTVYPSETAGGGRRQGLPRAVLLILRLFGFLPLRVDTADPGRALRVSRCWRAWAGALHVLGATMHVVYDSLKPGNWTESAFGVVRSLGACFHCGSAVVRAVRCATAGQPACLRDVLNQLAHQQTTLSPLHHSWLLASQAFGAVDDLLINLLLATFSVLLLRLSSVFAGLSQALLCGGSLPADLILRVRVAHRQTAALVRRLSGCMGPPSLLVLMTYMWGVVYGVTHMPGSVLSGCHVEGLLHAVDMAFQLSACLAVVYASTAVTLEATAAVDILYDVVNRGSLQPDQTHEIQLFQQQLRHGKFAVYLMHSVPLNAGLGFKALANVVTYIVLVAQFSGRLTNQNACMYLP